MLQHVCYSFVLSPALEIASGDFLTDRIFPQAVIMSMDGLVVQESSAILTITGRISQQLLAVKLVEDQNHECGFYGERVR